MNLKKESDPVVQRRHFAVIIGVVWLIVAVLSASCSRAASKLPPFKNTIGIEFIWAPPGEFVMGLNGGETDEQPEHEVHITQGFYIGKYEVTQEQWEQVMGNNPSGFKGATRPVETVSWNDAQAFIKKLNERGDGYLYRLPTEAEWEYACRAGKGGADKDNLYEAAWFNLNTDGQTHEVGQKTPNAWGLYDMRGNVLEWCQDWYDVTYYQKSPPKDPQGPEAGENRVQRGCSWNDYNSGCRSSYRYNNFPQVARKDSGLRLVVVKVG